MNQEDEKNILQHLLQLEAEATALVDEAQAEADRRVAEAEKQCREIHDKTWSAEVEKLEAAHLLEIAAIREEYKNELEAYRAKLKERSVDKSAFEKIARGFLLKAR